MENKHRNPQDCNYLNVPLSIISQRWFKSDNAVRAWFFYAWQSLLPHWEEHRTKTVKGKKFNLTEGEMICTRSYLAKSLGITDCSAKGSTDKLKRTDTISVTQEIISKDTCKLSKNRLSRVTVKGIPVPNEPYIRMVVPFKMEIMWTAPVLAQLYIYLMCKAEHKDVYCIGKGGDAHLLSVGDALVSYAELLANLKCKEYQLKNALRILETAGAITRNRIGNKGIVVHMNYYPEKKEMSVQKKTKESVTESKENIQTSSSSHPQKGEENEEIVIIQTPVTEAVTYLFSVKKRNKDKNRLNQIIEHVSASLPADFPLEKLPEVMDAYYEAHGEEYLEPKNLSRFIDEYHKKLRDNQNVVQYNNYREQELSKKEATLEKELKDFKKNWELVGKAYKSEYNSKGNVNSLTADEIQSVYYTLWCANKKQYINHDFFKTIPSPPRPESLSEVAKKHADYIEHFFSCSDSQKILSNMYEEENNILLSHINYERKNIQEERNRLRPAV